RTRRCRFPAQPDRLQPDPHSQTAGRLASRRLAIGKASATNRLHSEPNLTERLYEEEKRRTNALLFRFFSKLPRSGFMDYLPTSSSGATALLAVTRLNSIFFL